MTTVFVDVTFEAAHWLPHVPEGHKCHRLHGHSYWVRIEVEGPVDDHTGWVMDYADIKACWQHLHAVLDHRCLNDIRSLENSTSERIARWIFEHLGIPGLRRVTVRETPTAGAVYEP